MVLPSNLSNLWCGWDLSNRAGSGDLCFLFGFLISLPPFPFWRMLPCLFLHSQLFLMWHYNIVSAAVGIGSPSMCHQNNSPVAIVIRLCLRNQLCFGYWFPCKFIGKGFALFYWEWICFVSLEHWWFFAPKRLVFTGPEEHPNLDLALISILASLPFLFFNPLISPDIYSFLGLLGFWCPWILDLAFEA